MNLRNHLRMRYHGSPNWPPVWTIIGPNHKVLRGEIGVLVDAYANSIGSNICFVVIEVGAERYLGALLFDDRAFCRQILSLLQSETGHSIREIGSLNIQS